MRVLSLVALLATGAVGSPPVTDSRHQCAKGCSASDGVSLMQTTLKVSGGARREAAAFAGSEAAARGGAESRAQTQTLAASWSAWLYSDAVDERVDGVTVAMKCICTLSVLYFLVCVLLMLLRTHNEVMDSKSTDESVRFSAILERTASTSAVGVPMFGVVLLATQLLAEEDSIAGGHDATAYGLPEWWIQWAMVAGVALVMVGMFSSVIMLLSSNTIQVLSDSFRALYTIAMAFQPVAAFAVLSGTMLMERPYDVWLSGRGPATGTPISVICVMILAFLYFILMFLWRACQACESRFAAPLRAAAEIQELVPMLGVLFLAVRMRAVEVVGDSASSQGWAQICFLVCTAGVLAQSIAALVGSLLEVPDGEDRGGEGTASEDAGKLLVLIKSVLEAVIYVSLACILVSSLTIEAPEGKETPRLSPTLWCLSLLSIAFFGVHLGLFAARTLASQSRTPGVSGALRLCESAKESVGFCPMICVLFMGVRLRAIQLSLGKGSPQDWVQACMWISVAAIVLQLWLVLLSSMSTGKSAESPGSSDTGSSGEKKGHFFFLAAQYSALVVQFGATVAVIVGACMLNRSTVAY